MRSMESDCNPLLIDETKRGSALRRKNGMKLSSKRGSPWRDRQVLLRDKPTVTVLCHSPGDPHMADHQTDRFKDAARLQVDRPFSSSGGGGGGRPPMRPPVPPKPDSLLDLAAASRNAKLTSTTPVEAVPVQKQNTGPRREKPPRKFSSPAATSTPQKLTVTRSKSSHVIQENLVSDGHVLGSLIAKRKQFFHQLSLGVVENKGEETRKTTQDKKASWTSYLDLDEEASLCSSSSSSSLLDNFCCKEDEEEESPTLRQTLVSVEHSLAHAESLLSKLAVRRRSQQQQQDGQEEDADLRRSLVTRQQRISAALECLSRHSFEDAAAAAAAAAAAIAADCGDETDGNLQSTSKKSRAAEHDVQTSKNSRAFNLFRDNSPAMSSDSLSSSAAVTNGKSEDTGYMSESDSSFNLVKTRVRDFLFDSFGKGGNKRVKRQQQQRPVVVEVVGGKMASSGGGDLPFFVDTRVSERLVNPEQKGETPIDHTLFEAKELSVEQSTFEDQNVNGNRISVTSFTSGSSSSSNETVANPLYDSNENEIEMSPEEKQARKVFNIAMEMMTSEQEYVNSLKLINVDFKEFIEKEMRQKDNVIPQKDFDRLFSYLLELQILNADFLKDFQARIENWENEKKIADIIVIKGDFLKLYTSYVQHFPELSTHLIECCEKFENFGKLVLEFERGEKCRNLKISHFMLKPVQRLPQYKLLLETYLKNLSPSSEDYNNAINALNIVTKAAEHANEKMKQMDNFKKLLQLQDRLGETDLVQANRELLKSGEIQKISRSGTDQRFLILCSDILICAKYSGTFGDSTSLRAAYKIPLSNLQVTVPNEEEYPQDFNIISSVRSCTLHTANVGDRHAWVAALQKAIADHLHRRQTFSNAANVEKAAGSVQGILGESAPVWVPDARVTMCQGCHVDFTLLVRRHHCRACGRVVCQACSANKAPLKYRGCQASRVCNACYDELFKLKDTDDRLKNFKHLFKRDLGSRPIPGKHVPDRLQVKANDVGAQMSGYLHRWSKKSGKFKKRWFVLKDRVIYVYRASEDVAACESTLPVIGYDIEFDIQIPAELSSCCQNGRGFSLTHAGSDPLTFFAESEVTSEKWTAALLDAIRF